MRFEGALPCSCIAKAVRIFRTYFFTAGYSYAADHAVARAIEASTFSRAVVWAIQSRTHRQIIRTWANFPLGKSDCGQVDGSVGWTTNLVRHVGVFEVNIELVPRARELVAIEKVRGFAVGVAIEVTAYWRDFRKAA